MIGPDLRFSKTLTLHYYTYSRQKMDVLQANYNKLFDDINAYAKPPSQKERIFMSPVNGYFLITQNFTNHNPINDSFSHLINKKVHPYLKDQQN